MLRRKQEKQTFFVKQIALNCFDSKRFLLTEHFVTLHFKHYLTFEATFINQILLEDEWERSGVIILQNSDHILPDVDLMPEEFFVIPDQGYRQRKYSHKELNKNLAGSYQTEENCLPLNPFDLSEA